MSEPLLGLIKKKKESVCRTILTEILEVLRREIKFIEMEIGLQKHAQELSLCLNVN